MSLNKPKVSATQVITEGSDGKSRLESNNSRKVKSNIDPRRMPIDPNFGKISSVSISPSTPNILENAVIGVTYSDFDGGARLQHTYQTSGLSYDRWIQTNGTTFSVYVGGVTGSGIVKVRTVYQSRVFDQGVVDFNINFAGTFVKFTSVPSLSGYTMGEFSSLTYNISGDEPIDVSIKWTITE